MMLIVNLRKGTVEGRRRKTLCDKRDNSFVWKQFPPNFNFLLKDLFVNIKTQLYLLNFATNTQVIVLSRLSHKHFAVLFFVPSCFLSSLIGTLRSNDADGNENVKKKTILWLAKQQLARVPCFFVHFSARFCTTTTWTCLISRFMEDVNKQRRNFISLSVLGFGA